MQELHTILISPAGAVMAAALGAIWGSFLNVCIARVPRGESVVRPGSRCMACGHAVRGWDNIPILSYFILRGRCRDCGARFSIRYAGVEALTAALALLCWFVFVSQGHGPPALLLGRWALYFSFIAVLIVLSFIDIDTHRLPDVITLPSIPLFFLAAFAAHDVPWQSRAIGAAAGYLFVRLLSDGYYHLFGREGIGLGDGKLLALIGAVLGWKALPIVLFAASLCGVLVAIPLLLLRRRRADEPATVAGAVAETPGEPAAAEPPAEPATNELAEDADRAEGADRAEADEDLPLRRAEVPFGPYLAAAAVAFALLQQPIWLWMSETLLIF